MAEPTPSAKSSAKPPIEVFPTLKIPFNVAQLADTIAPAATTLSQLQQLIPQLTASNPDVAALMAQPPTTRPSSFHTAYRENARTDWPPKYPEIGHLV